MLEELLARHLPIPGVAALVARLPDLTFLHRSYTDWFTEAQLHQLLSRLAATADSLGQQGIQPLRLAWTFEHARILLALRGDGPCLAVFVENRPGFPAAKIDRLLDEFSAL
jgi:hypothetical protein